MDFSAFHIREGIPIYIQLVEYIKRGIIGGSIEDGEELPSRRVLSALLGINPNTVQKAFRLLEEEGLIESRTGAKSYMRVDVRRLEALKKGLLTEDIRLIVDKLQKMGISLQEAMVLIKENWGKVE